MWTAKNYDDDDDDEDDEDDDDDDDEDDDEEGHIWSDISSRSRHNVCPAASQQSNLKKQDGDDYRF